MTRTRGTIGREGLGRRPRRAATTLVLATLLVMSVGGCSLDGLLKSGELPADVSDPARIETPEGAVLAYRGLVGDFRDAFAGGVLQRSFVERTGLLSDELQPVRITSDSRSWAIALDRRTLVEGESWGPGPYEVLQRVRGQAAQATGLLARYGLPEQQALRGHGYALQAYAELFLAELFCSGIPLSTLDFDGDFTYQPGSTTAQVYEHALQLFDSALALAADSARLVHLARVGQARALLGLGRFAEAAAAAAQVPDAYRYEVPYTDAGSDSVNAQNFARINSGNPRWELTVADREGVNGLDYRTSGDPRTQVTSLGMYQSTAIYHPNKYTPNGASPVVLASAVEARLIEAEAALRSGGDWLGILNALRTTCIDPATCPTPAPAGSGGVAGLPPLADPGTDAARVDLLFRERAFWLFLTGHRQGDLRRLIRQYGRAQHEVYPTGLYPAGTGLSYGSDVTLPIPPEERTLNPRFTGCLSRDA